MRAAENVLVAVVVLLHLYFLVLEMFLWTKPFGMRTFGLKPELASASSGAPPRPGAERPRAGRLSATA